MSPKLPVGTVTLPGRSLLFVRQVGLLMTSDAVLLDGEEVPEGVLDAVPIVTGITDLDRVEVSDGLAEGESVLVLPSSSLVEAQERLQNFMRSRGGIPGMTQKPQETPGVQGQRAPR